MKRREFMKRTGMAVAGAAATPLLGNQVFGQENGSRSQPFMIGNSECYRPVGRGMYDETTDRTYQVYLNNGFRPWIIAYDHGKGEWSEPVQIDSRTYEDGQPDHFYPSMWMNDRGYIHVVWGAHGDPFKHLASKRPRDISSWEKRGEIGFGCYPQPIATNGGKEVYFFLTNYANPMYSEPRNLVLYKSNDGGDTFEDRRMLIEGSTKKKPGLYVGSIKHQPASDSEPEQFHIPWVANESNDGALYYCSLNTENGHVYSAQGQDMGKRVRYPDDWESHLVEEPDHVAVIPSTSKTKDGNPFVVWRQLVRNDDEPDEFHIHFSKYEPEQGKWVRRKIHKEPLPIPGSVGRGNDLHVLDDGTMKYYYPTGTSILELCSTDSGETWETETIFSDPERKRVTFVALMDSEHMGSDPDRHPDYQLTFKETGPTKGDKAQFAWGENGILGP